MTHNECSEKLPRVSFKINPAPVSGGCTMVKYRVTVFILTASLCAVLFTGYAAAADKPLVAIAIIKNDSPRTVVLTAILEENLYRIVESTGLFSAVKPAQFRDELKKFGCIEERCLLGFTRDAGISVLLRADFDDSDDFITLTLTAYGIDIPYQGSVIYSSRARIPMYGKYGTAEYSSITEEHGGIFISRFLKRYRMPVYFESDAKNDILAGRNMTGSFEVYRAEKATDRKSIRSIAKVGQTMLRAGRPAPSATQLRPGDFILAGYPELADSMDTYFYQRKKEGVLRKTAVTEALYALLATGPASATMPILAPFLGYYRNSDWNGFSLWAFNLAPYLYLEINGLANYWANYYKKKKSVPRDVQAQYYFGLYMLTAGGASLFADALSHTMLKKAAEYQGVQPFMGNIVTAGYLALVSGGGGHFYRGDRLWGYLYFHADNLLLYFTLREFFPDRVYQPLTGLFKTKKINPIRAYTLLSVTCAVKLGELLHAVFMRDRIRNDDIIENNYSVDPFISAGDGSGLNVGFQYSYRY